MDENRKKELFRSLSPEEFEELFRKLNPERVRLAIEVGRMESLTVKETHKRGYNSGVVDRYMKKAKELREKLAKTPIYLEETCVLSVITTTQGL